jgi:hypothetical protein
MRMIAQRQPAYANDLVVGIAFRPLPKEPLGLLWSEAQRGDALVYLPDGQGAPMCQLAHDLYEEPQVARLICQQALPLLSRHFVYTCVTCFVAHRLACRSCAPRG